MGTEHYLVLGAALLGIGFGSALSRSNLIAIVMAVATAASGGIIAIAALGRALDGRSEAGRDSLMFALSALLVLLVQIIVGCAVAYRRHRQAHTTDISDKIELRH